MSPQPAEEELPDIGDMLNGTAPVRRTVDALSSVHSARRPATKEAFVPQVMPNRPATANQATPGLPVRPPGAPTIAVAAPAHVEETISHAGFDNPDDAVERPDVKGTFDLNADVEDMLVRVTYWTRGVKGHIVNDALREYLLRFPEAQEPVPQAHLDYLAKRFKKGAGKKR